MQRLVTGSVLSLALLSAVGCSSEVSSRPNGGTAPAGPATSPTGTGTPGTGTGVGTPPQAPPGAAFGPTAIRRLTNTQYKNSVSTLLKLGAVPTDTFETEPLSQSTRYLDNNSASLTVSPILAKQYATLAEKLVKAYTVTPCAGGSETACGDTFIQTFGRSAYRRPLNATELQRYQALFAGELSRTGYTGAVTQVIETMLQSPNFVYRAELGDPAQGAKRSLNSHEIATELSYLLTDNLPDEPLAAAADAGQLLTVEQREQQARRLLTLDGAKPTLRHFLELFVGISRLEELPKDANVYPTYTPELRDAMKLETQTFIDDVLWQGDATFSTLLTAPYSFVNGPLAALYGAPDPGQGATLVKTSLNATERSGILTQPGVLARHSKAFESFPIGRGKFVRIGLLCQVLPSPPQNLGVMPVPEDPNLTTRERFLAHSASPSCSGCHALIDPVGFGLENYDGIGKFRTMENGKPVDASGNFTSTIDMDGPFQGGPALAQKLAGSIESKQCLALQAYRWAFGRDESNNEAARVDAIAQELAAGGLNIKELVVALTKSDNFAFRSFN
ncbi:MAG: DUF1592 domain-containing protein [Polyangiaceae bacterium]|nr:DUF1592 domain-containing protein [Polyangiaceae bacterium]